MCSSDLFSQFFFHTSIAEIEKLYYIALSGSEVERPAAAKIICGASLSRGWYIQVTNPIPTRILDHWKSFQRKVC